MLSALVYLGAFEWTREGARRPYVINEVMYSNGILVKEVDRLNKEGFLKNAKWVTNKEVTDANLLDAGAGAVYASVLCLSYERWV